MVLSFSATDYLLLLAATVTFFLASRLQDKCLWLLAAVVFAQTRIAEALSSIAIFLAISNSVQTANLPRCEFHDPGFLADRSLHNWGRYRCSLNDGILEHTDRAVGGSGGFRMGGSNGKGER